MHRHRNISAAGQGQQRVVGASSIHRVAWGLETALAAEKCALMMAESATKRER